MQGECFVCQEKSQSSSDVKISSETKKINLVHQQHDDDNNIQMLGPQR